ncbi:alpha/beta hydrolase [Microbacterium lacus]|uniref:Alpha/beta hydrolase n=1 Tax=Microbacterium lacus TaxID=415217 RepID=A0ABN2FXQ3_9MICO
MTTTIPAPPFDAELGAALSIANFPATQTVEMIPILRQGFPGMKPVDELLDEYGVDRRDLTISGHGGADIDISILTPRNHEHAGPGIYYIHGGGMVSGDRFAGIHFCLPWAVEHDAVVVTVEYRLAPEHPDPIPVEDCFAGLQWLVEHADEVGVDHDRLLVFGGSAGGGLAAGTTLLARDRGIGGTLIGQVLMCPMIDDRDTTTSSKQIDGIGVWDRGSNVMGWTALLGDRRAGDDVSIYAAPARAADLSGLPPTFIDAGSAEVFRDEAVDYASRIWAAGGSAELHIWSGGFHGFEGFAPHAALSIASAAARDSWVARLLGV